MIQIEALGENVFRVTVHGDTVTTHDVTVEPSYSRRLIGDDIETRKLVEKSFEFLLQRENNTQILRKFNLSVIQQHFTEFEGEIRNRIKR